MKKENTINVATITINLNSEYLRQRLLHKSIII